MGLVPAWKLCGAPWMSLMYHAAAHRSESAVDPLVSPQVPVNV